MAYVTRLIHEDQFDFKRFHEATEKVVEGA
jgi:hypothetical protein